MTDNAKRVTYFEYLADPIYLELLEARPEVSVSRLEYAAPVADNRRVLESTHVFQVTAARDDLPAQYFVNDALLAQCPHLLAVSSNGSGYDTVDLDACTAAGVLAVNQNGGNREAVAEHVLALMLNLVKRICETDRYMRRQSGIQRNKFMGTEIKGKTIGIVGLGEVGSRVAELCGGLFAMRVLAYDPYLDAEICRTRGAEKVELDDLLRQADFVSINCPRTAETLRMIGAREYGLMKPGVFFITTARGGIHDEPALAAALESGHIAGAGLDVWDVEPPRHDDPLLCFENVIASPHTAGVTKESRRNMARIAAEQVLTILDGRRPPRLLNPAVWPRYVERYEAILGRKPIG